MQSEAIDKETKMITEQELTILCEDCMKQLEKDYADKEMLKPQNNREYWLFTEVWQRFDDFINLLTREPK